MQVMAGATHGGAEGFFERLVIALGATDVDQTVVIRGNPGRISRLRSAGIEVTDLPFGGWFDFSTKPALKRLIHDVRPDIVLTWMNRATAAVPAGSHVHCARLGGYYDLKYYRRCRHLIGNTPDIVDYLVRNGWPGERAHYLPNFVEEETAKPLDRAVFETPKDVPLALALGRLHANKAFDTLLNALALVPDVYLWIAGEGPEEAALKARAQQPDIAGRVRFLGWRDDVPELLAAADMLVCSSRHEPLGNVVLEGWAQGVPVVATASQGPGKTIAHGDTGLLAPVDDANALGAEMARLAADTALRERLAEAGLAALRRSFGKEAVVGKYLAFFDRVRERR